MELEGKWRTSPGGPEDDVTAPELVITGGNGGVKGSPRGRVAAHIHQSRRRPLPQVGTKNTNWCLFSIVSGR